MAAKLKIPKFASETEEAAWWFEHRDQLSQAFQHALESGTLHRGTAARLARERAAGAIPTTTIRLDPDDIARARALAAKRGLRYQTYLKSLIHEALAREERKLAP